MSLKSWFERTFYPYPEPQGTFDRAAEAAMERTGYRSPWPSVGTKEAMREILRAQQQANPYAFKWPSAPTREEFAAWRDDPVTQFVMTALRRNADECREEWMKRSWEAGEADEKLLIAMRERHDALMGFTADYDAFCETLGVEPPREQSDAA